MAISRIKTDEELVKDASYALSLASADEYEQACADMVEALIETKSVEWWNDLFPRIRATIDNALARRNPGEGSAR
jgi:hypothetical protein